jgi:Tfp pilus assembly protein PilO
MHRNLSHCLGSDHEISQITSGIVRLPRLYIVRLNRVTYNARGEEVCLDNYATLLRRRA